ncbi:MAG: hypothetical protein J5994_08150 [Ruminococcus sp.]|nr:hypothetical protein [Ruminococcus sp.]
MAITEAHKKGNKKWDSENMLTISCRLRKEQVMKFRSIAEKQGQTANQMIKQFVLDTIERDRANEK